jgi:hypothetical protein
MDSKINIVPGDKALVTTEGWFYAPDGNSYKAVYGTVEAVRTAESTLGVKPNGRSTNWYLEIGNMTIAGCQIHYAVKTDKCSKDKSRNWSANAEHGINEYEAPSVIYFADE